MKSNVPCVEYPNSVMKIRHMSVPISLLFITLAFLTGCKEQEKKIRERGDSISRAQEEKKATELRINEMERELAGLTRANRETQAHNKEFEAKSAKSAAGEKLIVQSRTDLEVSLKRFSESVLSYRTKYLAP